MKIILNQHKSETRTVSVTSCQRNYDVKPGCMKVINTTVKKNSHTHTGFQKCKLEPQKWKNEFTRYKLHN